MTPLAAAAVLGGNRRLALGAALSAAAAALEAVLQLSGATYPVPQGVLGAGLALLAIITSGFGLAGALLLVRRKDQARAAVVAAETAWASAMLEGYPGLLLGLRPGGEVCAAYGTAPEGIDMVHLCLDGLISQVDPSQRVGLSKALHAVQASGEAQVAFAPHHAPDRTLVAHFRRAAPDLVVASLRDITRQRAFEAGLESARADAETRAEGRGRFLAHMSHELRTPLNAIMGFSDIMRAGLFGPLEGRYTEYAQLIHESGAHLLDLIGDVLDVSKIEADRYELSREMFDAREAVSGALRLVRQQAEDASLKLRGVLPPAPMLVDADRRAMKQIVLNLVSNALKFTPRGGSVTVTLQDGAEAALEIVVADTGSGIAPTDLERLGRPFEQAGDAEHRTRGSGLGLSLVRAFAALHGGEMILESRLGEGTAVTVRLPVRVAAEPAAAADMTMGPGWGENVVAFDPRR
jgi:cell cycle sensor histidine kinase DivJ